MKHVIITGGSGFLGSHLCDRFLSAGYAVTAVDNLVTGRESNLESAAKQADRFQFIRHDVSEPLDDRRVPLIARHGLESVLHFACPASPVDFDRIPMEILKVDSLGTIRLAELASKFAARFVVASTSEVYGDPLVHPQTEGYWGNVNPTGPRACYDETKRFSEAYVSTVNRVNPRFRGGIVRIFNTYGPRMRLDDGRVVPELCAQALAGEPLTLHGDGSQTRSFCYVSDLIEGIFKYAESELKEPVNIGNPDEHSIADFARTIIDLTGSGSKLVRTAPRPDDPKKRRPDISKAKRLLDWEPRIGLREGLERTIKHFRGELDRSRNT